MYKSSLQAVNARIFLSLVDKRLGYPLHPVSGSRWHTKKRGKGDIQSTDSGFGDLSAAARVMANA